LLRIFGLRRDRKSRLYKTIYFFAIAQMTVILLRVDQCPKQVITDLPKESFDKNINQLLFFLFVYIGS